MCTIYNKLNVCAYILAPPNSDTYRQKLPLGGTYQSDASVTMSSGSASIIPFQYFTLERHPTTNTGIYIRLFAPLDREVSYYTTAMG
jgi:hypothetical protein